MATVVLSGYSGDGSGIFSPGPGTASHAYSYSTGWSNIPIGSKIIAFDAYYSTSISGGVELSSAEAYVNWPGSGYASQSSGGGASVFVTSSAPTNVFFSGDPGNTGAGWVSTSEYFYSVSYSFSATSTPTVTFDPPGSRTLFFGTAN